MPRWDVASYMHHVPACNAPRRFSHRTERGASPGSSVQKDAPGSIASGARRHNCQETVLSLINVIRGDDEIFVYTDGATYLPDGTLIGSGPKISLAPHLPAVISSRGPMLLHEAFTGLAGQFDSYDTIKASAASIAAEAIKFLPQQDVRGGQIVVAGFTNDGLADSYCVQRNDTGFEVQQLGPVFMRPADIDFSIEAVAARRLEVASNSETVVIGLCEMQRFMPCPVDGGAVPIVGCFLQKTVIRKSGITTSVIKRWSDILGEKIRPEYDEVAA